MTQVKLSSGTLLACLCSGILPDMQTDTTGIYGTELDQQMQLSFLCLFLPHTLFLHTLSSLLYAELCPSTAFRQKSFFPFPHSLTPCTNLDES